MPIGAPNPVLLRDLRELAGLTDVEVAGLAGLAVTEVRRAERRWPSLAVVVRLAGLYGAEPGPLFSGVVRPAPDEGASLFLFSGAVSDLDPAQIGAFRAALHYARAHAATSGEAGLKERQRHSPLAPASPAPRDAARQGYRLARQVRAALGLRADVIGDLRALLEDRLGVAVTVAPLTGAGAVGILDARRAGAAVVLDAALPPRRCRVALAHELCHLLFDPSGVDLVSWSFDTADLSERSHDLKEARARGFAAEFLLPLPGLIAHFGAPARVSGADRARELANEARARFGTTWEITVNHLYNLGFLSTEAWESLIRSGDATPFDPPSTPLPAPGAPPLGLAASDIEDATALARSTRALAVRAESDVRRRRDERAEELLAACVQRAQAEPMQAAVTLTTAVDDAFAGGDPGVAESVLRNLRKELPADTLVMILSGLRAACLALGGPLEQAYRLQVERVVDLLPAAGWTDDDVRDAKETLR